MHRRRHDRGRAYWGYRMIPSEIYDEVRWTPHKERLPDTAQDAFVPQRVQSLRVTLPRRRSSSGASDAQDDPLAPAGADHALDTHDYPVLKPVLSADDSGQVL